ncbi:DUF6049 family protein [Nonomuraea sp. bgisy101]|uniref:DUF6049 family protein n=1 Tax=Nonomuraea sp. bgisy101 TaxID=3413784 RepID=UPI003D75A7F1
MGRRVIRKATLLSVLIAVLLTAMVVTPASTAATTITAQQVRLTIESITPDVPRKPTDVIKVTGKLTNSGTTPLTNVLVRLRPSRQQFTGRAAMEEYLAGGFVSDYASRSSTLVLPSVPAGGSTPFELTTTPMALTLSRFGVYPLGVEVLANGWQPAANVRTFLTYAPPDAKLRKNKIAFALPIIDQPRRSDNGLFIDENLRTSLLGDGRLADLLRIAKSQPKNVTWFVEPALLDDVMAMTAPYKVRPKSGTEVSRPGDTSAAGWLAAIRTALAGQEVVATPYADPDITALAHQGLDEETAKAIKIGGDKARELLKRDVPATTAWPVAGKIDEDALDLLTVSGVTTVLLNADNLSTHAAQDTAVNTSANTSANTGANTLPAVTPDAATTIDSVSGPVKALVADPVLSRTLELEKGVPGSSTLQKQRFVAETAMIAGEQGGTLPRSLVVAPARRWNPNPAHVTNLLKTAASLPWLTSVPLGSIKPTKASAPHAGLTYTDTDRKAELSKKYLASVKRVAAKAALTSGITSERLPSVFDTAVLRLTSSAWRTKTGTGSAEVKRVNEVVDESIGRVFITGSDSRTRSLAGEEGQIPVSVKNARDEPVSLTVQVTSDSPDLLEIVGDGKPQRLDIGAKQSGTIQVQMRVKVSGDSLLTIRLRTLDNKAYQKPAKLTIKATGYTGIALVIVGAALSVMLAAVVMRVLRRRSQRRAAKSAKPRENEHV